MSNHQRLVTLVCTVGLLTGCEKTATDEGAKKQTGDDRGSSSASGQAPTPEPEPELRVRPLEHPDPCPQATTVAKPVLLGDGVAILNDQMPLRWASREKQRVYELGPDIDKPVDLGPVSNFKAADWDEQYWYTARCFERCENNTSMGVPLAVERIDRKTGERKRLGKGIYGFGNLMVYGDHIYFGEYGHQIGGGVHRVSKSTGEQSQVWGEDKVERLQPFPDGILVTATRSVGWIPRDGPSSTVFSVKKDLGAATMDSEAYYVAEYGDPYWQAADSGFIHRVPRNGGSTIKLAGPIHRPTAIAVHDDVVYFMLEDSTTIYAVSTNGGAVIEAFAEAKQPESKDKPCDESLKLWAEDRGLLWTRGVRFFGAPKLYFASWAQLRRPQN